MNPKAGRKIGDNHDVAAPPVRQPGDRLINTDDDCNSPSWRWRLTQAVVSAVVSGFTRALFGWALTDFHP